MRLRLNFLYVKKYKWVGLYIYGFLAHQITGYYPVNFPGDVRACRWCANCWRRCKRIDWWEDRKRHGAYKHGRLYWISGQVNFFSRWWIYRNNRLGGLWSCDLARNKKMWPPNHVVFPKRVWRLHRSNR